MDFKERDKNLDESISIDSKYNISKGFSIDDIEYDGKIESAMANATQKTNNKKEYISFGIDKDELQKRLSGDEDERREYRNIFVSKEQKEEEDQRQDISWYIKMVKWPAMLIVLINFLIIIKESTNYFSGFVFLDYIRLPFEICVFIVLSYIVVQKKHQIPKISGIAGIICGFMSGIVISTIELFVYREMWAIFNLATTTLFFVLIGLIVGLIFGAIFYQDKKILLTNK